MVVRFLGALGAAALLSCSTPAFAHAVLTPPEAREGAVYRAVVQIMHGCNGSPTTGVTVTIPEGAIGARPMPKPGWTLETKRGAYARTYSVGSGPMAEGIQEIAWTGGPLPDDQFDEFLFSVRMSGAFPPGAAVHFPVVQTCAAGVRRWVEVPAPGQDPDALASPAPSVRIVAAAAQTGPAPVKVGALVIERPWMRATPAGAKVAGGYVRIANTGTEPDRLVGSTIPLAARGEVHEMTNEGGVMKMRALDRGIEIGPGETVELKPGGLHLMFLDLTAGPKAGDAVRGTLSFEKAGTVEVTFAVAPVGAPGPSPAHHH